MGKYNLRTLKSRKTLKWIRSIIARYGINVREIRGNEISPCYRYVHLHIVNDGMLPMGLIFNGRGLTWEQALVSAYGELMERLQTMLVFDKKYVFSTFYQNKMKWDFVYHLSFTYAPDEVVRPTERHEEVYLPFYHVNTGKVKQLPYRLIEFQCGSNGTASGNTISEAIMYALLEMYERYALRLLYTRRLSPPNIFVESFKQTKELKAVLEFCTKNQLLLFIKDCSCGEDLPVIGVLLQHKVNKSYFFSLAASLDRDTALSHALSEIFQGNRWHNMQPYDLHTLTSVEHDYIKNDNERIKYQFGNHNLYRSFFYEKPSYSPMSWDKYQVDSIETGLNLFIDKLKNAGKDIYIRDVSYLGFPTVVTYIPTMSEIIDFENDRWYRHSFGLKEKISLFIHSIPSLNEQDFARLLEMETEYVQPIAPSLFVLNDAFMIYPPGFIFAVFALKLHNRDLAMKFLQPLVQHEISNAELEHLAELVPDLIKSFVFSDCFKCSNCNMQDNCRIESYYNFLVKLENIYKDHLPSQDRLKWLS